MKEWFYKATPSRVSFEATRALAVDDGFLCRSAYTSELKRVANTQAVDFGHLIHIYYVEAGTARAVGSFEVVGPARHPHGRHFPSMVQSTRLAEADDEFADKLRGLDAGRDGEPYREDPHTKRFTGWLLRPRPDVATPAYEDTPIAGVMPTLLARAETK